MLKAYFIKYWKLLGSQWTVDIFSNGLHWVKFSFAYNHDLVFFNP